MTATNKSLKFELLKIIATITCIKVNFMDIYSYNQNGAGATGTDEYIQYLRDRNVPTKETYLPRMQCGTYGLYDDKIPTTYEYYRKFINDILRNIRRGKTDYCYELYQIRELLRFEPDLQVEYSDRTFAVSLPKDKVKK